MKHCIPAPLPWRIVEVGLLSSLATFAAAFLGAASCEMLFAAANAACHDFAILAYRDLTPAETFAWALAFTFTFAKEE